MVSRWFVGDDGQEHAQDCPTKAPLAESSATARRQVVVAHDVHGVSCRVERRRLSWLSDVLEVEQAGGVVDVTDADARRRGGSSWRPRRSARERQRRVCVRVPVLATAAGVRQLLTLLDAGANLRSGSKGFKVSRAQQRRRGHTRRRLDEPGEALKASRVASGDAGRRRLRRRWPRRRAALRSSRPVNHTRRRKFRRRAHGP